ncbi:hypothetical protein KQI84_07500 [bacterium]|nr:hypothetical protein [bacterium]
MLKNFQTTSIFLGLFLRKLEVQDYRNFADTLPWRLPEFDNEPQLAPVPPDAKPDMSRVRFMSKDTRLMMEVAPARIQFRMMPGEVTKTEQGMNLKALPVAEAFDQFIPQAMRIHTTLSEHFGATALRVGVVTDIISPVPSSANQRMQQHILGNPNIFGERLSELQMSAASRTQLEGGIGINRRLGIRSMRTNQPGNPDLLLNINIDINTLAEESYDVSTTELEKFLRGALKHMDNNIPLMNERSLFE